MLTKLFFPDARGVRVDRVWREGQVNRLKVLKRGMYGRASFDLLRQRVLHAA